MGDNEVDEKDKNFEIHNSKNYFLLLRESLVRDMWKKQTLSQNDVLTGLTKANGKTLLVGRKGTILSSMDC